MNRLKELREKSGLRLRELERYVGISNSALCLIENGRQPMREIHVLKLTSFFDVTSDYLLGYKDDGIGVYFEDEHEYVSEEELHALRQQHHMEEALVTKSASGLDITAGLPEQKTRTYTGRHSIFRSVDVNRGDAGISDSVKEKIVSELNHLDNRELEKVLKFIQEYIK